MAMRRRRHRVQQNESSLAQVQPAETHGTPATAVLRIAGHNLYTAKVFDLPR